MKSAVLADFTLFKTLFDSKWIKWTNEMDWFSFVHFPLFPYFCVRNTYRDMHPSVWIRVVILRDSYVVAKKSAHNGTTFRKNVYLCGRESYMTSPSGKLASFDPSENLQIQSVWVISLGAVPPVMHRPTVSLLCVSACESIYRCEPFFILTYTGIAEPSD